MVIASQTAFRLNETRSILQGKWIVDLFCGAGGWSTGIERATGRSPDLCVNHWDLALKTHECNHPGSRHVRANVWDVEPRKAVRGNPVGLLVLSPDCTDFSRAKGGKPVRKSIRGLANVGIKWVRDLRPDVVFLENVSEFQEWGPLDAENKRIESRKGEYFRRWVASLERLGYVVDWRVLKCSQNGDPTSRRRLFLVARCDGQPIRFPTPTHGPGLPNRERVVAECINFSLPCPSIFGRRKELADATKRRLAVGAIRYIVENPNRFILNLTHGGRVESVQEPIKTITGANRGEKALVAPTLIQTGYGERKGQAPRVLDLHKPIGTLVDGQKHAVAVGVLKNYTGVIGQEVTKPASTITAKDHHSLIAASLSKFYGTGSGADVAQPCPTITAGGTKGGNTHLALQTATLIHYYSSGGQDQAVTDPIHAIVGKARHALVTGVLGGDVAGAIRCAEFLVKYGDFQPKNFVEVDGQVRPVVIVDVDGVLYLLTDLGLRMLQPDELKVAQGFAPDYVLLGTKADQVKMIGNSVPPGTACAMVEANFYRKVA